MKPIRLQVQMPVIGMFSIGGRSGVCEIEQLVETTVIGLRRSEHNGARVEGRAIALTFVPEQFRRHLRETKRLVGDEHAWLAVKLADNKKSLAPFMASGDREWGRDSEPMKVAELVGGELDFWVARASGVTVELKNGAAIVERVRVGVLDGVADPANTFVAHGLYRPSTDWMDGGVLIEQERIALFPAAGDANSWMAQTQSGHCSQFGETALIAAMRTHVMSKFGDEVQA